MEPQNRPYVDPDMKPGDAGTEPWADGLSGGSGPLADGGTETDAEGAIDGSPADIFDDGDAIANAID